MRGSLQAIAQLYKEILESEYAPRYRFSHQEELACVTRFARRPCQNFLEEAIGAFERDKELNWDEDMVPLKVSR